MPRWSCLVLTLLLASAAGDALAQADQMKIGVFDPEALWKETELGKKYNADLFESRDRLLGNIDKKKDEIEALRDKVRQQQASLSEDKVAQMQKDIQNKGIELDRLSDDVKREMNSQLNDVQSTFQKMLLDTLDAFGKEKGFTLILNKGVTDYNAPQIEITKDLIAKFNEMHKVPPSSAAKPPTKKTPEKPKS
jgi:outer membrane protein